MNIDEAGTSLNESLRDDPNLMGEGIGDILYIYLKKKPLKKHNYPSNWEGFDVEIQITGQIKPCIKK